MKKVMLVLVLVVFSLPLFAAGQSEGEEPYIHDNSFGFSFLTGFSFSDGSNDFQNTLGINAFYHPVRFLAIEAGFNFSVTSEDKERQGTASFATGETNYSSYGGKLGLFAFIP